MANDKDKRIMDKETIRQEALKAEQERFPRCAGDRAFHGVNSAYGLGFVDGAQWALESAESSIEKVVPIVMDFFNELFIDYEGCHFYHPEPQYGEEDRKELYDKIMQRIKDSV